MSVNEGNVTDWATDFDVGDPGYQQSPYEVWDDLRDRCPVAHTERRGGAHLPVNWDDIVAVAYDTDNFSSRDVGVLPPPAGSSTLLSAPPITSDPPFHTDARRILLPRFAPRAVDQMEGQTRAIANQLLDRL
ncbi:MAG: cytochrome P450, partial [Actinomycetota bacterium]